MSDIYYLKVEIKKLGVDEPMELPKADKTSFTLRDYREGLDLIKLITMLHIVEPTLRETIPDYLKCVQKIRHFIENP